MKSKIIWLLLIFGLFIFSGCDEDEDILERSVPELEGISFTVLSDHTTVSNKKVIMVIDIINPDDQEIIAVEVNGQEIKKENFMITSSNSTILILINPEMYNDGDFIVNKIKYLDGIEEKSVTVEGNNRLSFFIDFDINADVEVFNKFVTSTTFAFDVAILPYYYYIDEEDVVYFVRLENDPNVIEVKSLNSYNEKIVFTDLDVNKDYHYEIIANYKNIETILYADAFRTTHKVNPTNVVSTKDEITFNLDIYKGVELINVEIYEQENKISTLEDFSLLKFSNLNLGTKYTIKIEYKFDLNNQEIVETYSFDYTTLAEEIKITNAYVQNKHINIGEDLHIGINLNKPENVILKAIVVNNIKIDVVNNDFQFVRFVPRSITGTYVVKIEKFIYELNGIEVTQLINYELEEIVNIFSLDLIEIANNNDNVVADEANNDLYISLNNPNNLEIRNITIKYNNGFINYETEEIEKIDQHTIKVPWKGRTLFDKSNVFESLEFSNISFFDAKFNYTGFYSREYKQKFAVLNSTNIKEIRTKEDLVNLEDGYYYKLMNDLDLKGVVWNPLVFNGIFDGGGKTIKNLDVLFSDDKAEVTIGMFKEFNGILKNLNIRNAITMVNANRALVGGLIGEGTFILENCDYEGYFKVNSSKSVIGGFAGKAINANFKYNKISASIVSNGNAQSFNITGGIVGECLNTNISENRIIPNVHLKDFINYYVGGVVGDCKGKASIANNIIEKSTINLETKSDSGMNSFAGGVVGYASNMKIENNLILCTINFQGRHINYGGIVGIAYQSNINNNLQIHESVSTITLDTYGNYIDLFLGRSVGSQLNNNFYANDRNVLVKINETSYYLYKANVNLADFNNLDKLEFYLDKLNWDQNIWNLEKLDYINGLYPSLKWEKSL